MDGYHWLSDGGTYKPMQIQVAIGETNQIGCLMIVIGYHWLIDCCLMVDGFDSWII